MIETSEANARRTTIVWRTACFVFATAFFCVLILNGYGLLAVPGVIDYSRAGSWGDFIAAIGTVSAVSVALYSSLHEAEKSRNLALELIKEKRLAKTRVYAWLAPERERDIYSWKIMLRNDLDAPIYNWVVDFMNSQADAKSEDLGPIFPGSKSLIVNSLQGTAPTDAPKIAFRFEAPDGVWWQRNDRGELSIVSENEGVARV